MAYASVDQLQRVLANEIFGYTRDPKKAAGRALGTLVEVITFYLLKSWGVEHSIGIERALVEYGNPEIAHNVEYSLHPTFGKQEIVLPTHRLPLSGSRILAKVGKGNFSDTNWKLANGILLTTDGILRNACTIAHGANSRLVATLRSKNLDEFKIDVVEQYSKPYAIFECKRVGIEEGTRKGPQTIEKAKQGAYVARTVSCLHKVRRRTGELYGLVYKANGTIYSKPYKVLLAEIIASKNPEFLRDFILTVGVVSNHGNWFTSENHNKELKVLAQSYAWLLFLTDEGLAEFITELLLEPKPALQPARIAFLASYLAEKKANRFTKVQMAYDADAVLQAYFKTNPQRIESWFNIIAPENGKMRNLESQIRKLRKKDWRAIHLS